jgi:hypothetical protein
MDAMDRMDDDGSPESEEAHGVAAESVDQASGKQAERANPVVDASAAPLIEVAPEPSRATAEAPSGSEHIPSAGTDQSASASSEPVPSPGTDPAASSDSAPATSALPENQGGPAPNRGTTSSAQSVPDPDAQ